MSGPPRIRSRSSTHSGLLGGVESLLSEIGAKLDAIHVSNEKNDPLSYAADTDQLALLSGVRTDEAGKHPTGREAHAVILF
jgi:hypothetical protein